LSLFSNVVLGYTPGFYYGAIQANNGRIVYVPGGSGNVGIFSPATNSFTTILVGAVGAGYPWIGGVGLPDGTIFWPPSGTAGRGVGIFNPSTNLLTSTLGTYSWNDYYSWPTLCPDGRVVCPAAGPSTAANIGVYNPATNSFVSYAAGQAGLGFGLGPGAAYQTTCNLPDGRMVFTPSSGQNVGVFNPETNSYTSYAYGAAGTGFYISFVGSVLVPDGRVVFVPHQSDGIGTFDYRTNTFRTYPHGFGSGQQIFHTGCLLPTGEVFMPSYSRPLIGIFNPITNTVRTIPTPINFGVCQPTVLPDGRVMLAPTFNSNLCTITGLNKPVPPEFLLSPLFNKC
jgi:hypothetical protein